ncbi:AraC family transcriptional regulator [Paenibacillus melissococcoides]|uniref:AraC family transcriptional regulator n=1 Tax=Paenibacillus melissococcoides TaxID=2912268 RepID=A0ABM9G0T6_9BACL|nr:MULTISPECIES: AraC family transcriptional regulator [Paenibacillus]MEB9894706.1 AraC family transcriptional regulator [Bacillus cereus]CAH8244920.1 AraC family transcriptional regulator [Paenibacillus melissococcoides]CAH8709369.1 AraC family transcriptional regulator [Paenibacillus melissococcoides]CAH8710096.1 AraC family transcriptional regulator [Paenibacillus melissococcoides]GIO79859.1 AraC family transcriptional regulator [Paenibacillus dendritiformis]
MTDITFYRDDALPFLEVKRCHKNDLSYQKHFHEEYSIGLIDEGETHAWCDGVLWRVETGRMISFPPLILHACQPANNAQWKYKMLFIKPEWFAQLELPDINRLHIPFLLEKEKNKACSKLLNRTMGALTRNGSPLEIETALIEMMHKLVSKHASDLTHEPYGMLEPKYVNLIKEYIHAHYTDRITLETLEQKAGISRYHLIRMFKKSTHVPPHAYQNLLRINHAKKELKNRRPIAEIAVDTGFYDQSHFAKAFAKIVGATPQTYAMSV